MPISSPESVANFQTDSMSRDDCLDFCQEQITEITGCNPQFFGATSDQYISFPYTDMEDRVCGDARAIYKRKQHEVTGDTLQGIILQSNIGDPLALLELKAKLEAAGIRVLGVYPNDQDSDRLRQEEMEQLRSTWQ